MVGTNGANTFLFTQHIPLLLRVLVKNGYRTTCPSIVVMRMRLIHCLMPKHMKRLEQDWKKENPEQQKSDMLTKPYCHRIEKWPVSI